MTFSIENDYSILNNYSYQGKSYFISCLDFLSAPCRKIFGGRNVKVLSQQYSSILSIKSRIIAALFCVVIFPAGILAVSSFIVKTATFPWFWQKKIVKLQSQETLRIIQLFDESVRNKDIEGVRIALDQRPEIQESGRRVNFYHLIDQRIEHISGWDEQIEKAMLHISKAEARFLVKKAVKVRLENELNDIGTFKMNGEDIFTFVVKSVPYDRCCREILSEVLCLDWSKKNGPTSFEAPFRLELANSLISFMLSRIKQDMEDKGEEFVLKDVVELSLLGSCVKNIFFIDALTKSHFKMLLNKYVESIREINKEADILFQNLMDMEEQQEKVSLKEIGDEIFKFSNGLYIVDVKEKEVHENLQRQLRLLAVYNDEKDKEKVLSIIERLGLDMKNKMNKFLEGINKKNISEQILSSLMEKRIYLIDEVITGLKEILFES